MFHKSLWSGENVGVKAAEITVKLLKIDDFITESILKEHNALRDEWANLGKETKDEATLERWKAYSHEMAQRILEKTLKEAGLDNPSDNPSI